MPAGVVNSDATFIPDEAEVWIALKADVANISALIPADASTMTSMRWAGRMSACSTRRKASASTRASR